MSICIWKYSTIQPGEIPKMKTWKRLSLIPHHLFSELCITDFKHLIESVLDVVAKIITGMVLGINLKYTRCFSQHQT